MLFCVIFGCMFALYHLPLAAVLYPAILCAFLGMVFLGIEYKKAYEKHRELVRLQKLNAELIQELPNAESIAEEDYRQLVRLLCEEQAQLATKMNATYNDMMEYYTVIVYFICICF